MTNVNWLVGNGTETAQWESGNLSSFPLERGQTVYPDDFIVDACIACPIGTEMTIACGHVGPSLVSVSILADGKPALFGSVTKNSFKSFSPVVLRSTSDGVSGMVSFGDINFGEPKTYRGNVKFCDSVLVHPVLGRLKKFVDKKNGTVTSGSVGIETQDGVYVSILENGMTATVMFSADAALKKSVTFPCLEDDKAIPVKSLNGVKPDENGRIAIVFARDESEVPA